MGTSIHKRYLVGILLLLFFLPLETQAEAEESQQVQQGILDLRNFPLDENTLELQGDWAFEWGKLLNPDEITNQSAKAFIQAPSTWEKGEFTGGAISNEGYGTYQLKILLNDEDANRLLSLYIPPIASAYSLWVGGDVVAQNGVVGTSRRAMKPKSYAKTVTIQPKGNSIDLTVQVSNFSQRKGGMWSPITFGSQQAIQKQREQNMIKEVAIASCLLALSFYHLSFYLFRARMNLPLFLGIFCSIVAIRTLLVGDILLMYMFPVFPWELSVKIEYLTSYLGLMTVFLFFANLFPKESNKLVLYVSVAVCLGFSMTTLLPASLFTHFIQYFQAYLLVIFIYFAYVIVKATIRKREGALLNLVSLVCIVLAVVNDIFYYNQLINSVDLTPIAAAIFLLAQTLVVSKKSSQATKRVAQLSEELTEVNRSLEKKVEERTQKLVTSNAHLEHIEKTRKAFFSTITHELMTPMQTIRGYIQLLETNARDEKQRRYLSIIHEKTQFLNFLIKDLIYLAKVDEGQIEFAFEEMDSKLFLSHFYHRFKHDIEQADLVAGYEVSDVPESATCLVRVDIFRMEQVFSNLIHNAIKFTPKGEEITIRGSYSLNPPPGEKEVKGFLIVEIIDNGMGIEKEILPFIFERFVKGTNAIASRKGTGLGLPISREIIESHEGQISANNNRGNGSCFVIKLPAVFIMEDRNDESDHINR